MGRRVSTGQGSVSDSGRDQGTRRWPRRRVSARSRRIAGSGRAGPRPRPCRAARCRCRTSATGRTTGTRRAVARPAIASRVAVEPRRRPAIAALGEAGAARVPVVDEDRRQPGVRVQGGRDAADVPPVGRSRRAGASRSPRARRRGRRPGMPASATPVRRAASTGIVHHTAFVAQRARRQVERVLAEHLAAGQPAQERGHLVAHRHVRRRSSAPVPSRACSTLARRSGSR